MTALIERGTASELHLVLVKKELVILRPRCSKIDQPVLRVCAT